MADDQQWRAQAHPSFRFVVDIDNKRQAVFTECTLPAIEWEVEEVKEGGLNTYTHQLPGRRKSAKVSLKNGVGKSELLKWYFSAMEENFERHKVTITLLDATHDKVMVWNATDAVPVRWVGPELRTSDATIAIQTLELACGRITVSYDGSA